MLMKHAMMRHSNYIPSPIPFLHPSIYQQNAEVRSSGSVFFQNGKVSRVNYIACAAYNKPEALPALTHGFAIMDENNLNVAATDDNHPTINSGVLQFYHSTLSCNGEYTEYFRGPVFAE